MDQRKSQMACNTQAKLQQVGRQRQKGFQNQARVELTEFEGEVTRLQKSLPGVCGMRPGPIEMTEDGLYENVRLPTEGVVVEYPSVHHLYLPRMRTRRLLLDVELEGAQA
jgi:hypothetical protein